MNTWSLCAKDEADTLLHSDATTLDGKIPVSLSEGGGVLRRDHSRPGDRPGLRANLSNSVEKPPAVKSSRPRSTSPPIRACSIYDSSVIVACSRAFSRNLLRKRAAGPALGVFGSVKGFQDNFSHPFHRGPPIHGGTLNPFERLGLSHALFDLQ